MRGRFQFTKAIWILCFSLVQLNPAFGTEDYSLKVPRALSFQNRGDDLGTPGASIYSLQYSDGMNINVALYEPDARFRGHTNKPPIGIVAGYTMDISYLHFQAQYLRQRGYPVFIVQPPGNGRSQIRSEFPDRRDGYHNTIEGFAALYMDGLGSMISDYFQRRVILMGHSRAGYQMRFFLTGLRYAGNDHQGRPVLLKSDEALQQAQEHFLAIGSLYSPLDPDPRLVTMARNSPASIARLGELEMILRSKKARSVRSAGGAGFLLGALSPLNLIWGPLAIPAALVNGAIAAAAAEAQANSIANVIEEMARGRTAALLTGRRQLDKLDTIAVEEMRRQHGDMVPSFEQMQTDIE